MADVPISDVVARVLSSEAGYTMAGCADAVTLAREVIRLWSDRAGSSEYVDWTADGQGFTNSSPVYVDLVAAVEGLIRRSAHELLAGRADMTARLIVSQLAHVHGLMPGPKPVPVPFPGAQRG